MDFLVYRITNQANGMIYIGQTTKRLKRRLAQHIYAATHEGMTQCRYLYAAIRKYGANNFVIDVLERCETKKAMDRAEQGWIERLGARTPEVGYNICPGGKANAKSPEGIEALRKSTSRMWSRPGTRERMSRAATAQMSDPANREYLRHLAQEQMKDPANREKSRQGGLNRRGWHHSPETKEKIRQANLGNQNCKGRKDSEETVRTRAAKCRKPIVCVSTGQRFDGVTTAAKFYDCNPGAISRVASGVRKAWRGLVFVYGN